LPIFYSITYQIRYCWILSTWIVWVTWPLQEMATWMNKSCTLRTTDIYCFTDTSAPVSDNLCILMTNTGRSFRCHVCLRPCCVWLHRGCKIYIAPHVPWFSLICNEYHFQSINKGLCTPRPCLVTKLKILNLSHQTGVLHAWSIKSRRNKQLIAYFAYKLRDEFNKLN